MVEASSNSEINWVKLVMHSRDYKTQIIDFMWVKFSIPMVGLWPKATLYRYHSLVLLSCVCSHRKRSVVWRTSSGSHLQLVTYQCEPGFTLIVPPVVSALSGCSTELHSTPGSSPSGCELCNRSQCWQPLHNMMLRRTVWSYNYRRVAWQYRDILFIPPPSHTAVL